MTELPPVLFVTTSTSIGGAEKTLHLLATSLRRHRAAGVVCLKRAGPYAGRLQEAGIPVWSLGMGRLPSPAVLSALRARLAGQRPPLVHAFLYAGIQLSRACRALGLPFRLVSSPRVTYRTRPLPLLWVDAALRRFDDVLVAESRASEAFFIRELGYEPSKVGVILNGVERREPPTEEARRAARRELGLPQDAFVVGCVGRLDPQKGQRVLLRAMARAPGVAALVGDGPDRRPLERALRELGLEGRCRIAGERPDASRLWAAFDVAVQPSMWEGTPNAVLEAMAAGLPVVASSVDGVTEVLEDGRTGRLVPPGDPLELARAIRELAEDADARRRLGSAARERARSAFDPASMVESYEKVYDRVLRGSAA